MEFDMYLLAKQKNIAFFEDFQIQDLLNFERKIFSDFLKKKPELYFIQ